MRHYFKARFPRFTFGLAFLLLASVGGLSSCTLVVSSGIVSEKSFFVSNFDSVEVSSALNVTISQGNGYSALVTADSSVIDSIDVYTAGSTLRIRVRPGFIFSGGVNTQIRVVMPLVRSVGVSGASFVRLEGFIQQAVDCDVSGASTLRAADAGAAFRTAYVDVSGLSTLFIRVSDQISGSISGASSVHNSGLVPDVSSLFVSGASSFFVW